MLALVVSETGAPIASFQKRADDHDQEAAQMLGSASVIIENLIGRNGPLGRRFKRQRAEQWLAQYDAHMAEGQALVAALQEAQS